MTNPLHASWYADRAIQRRVDVVENVRLARDTYRLRFACRELARRFLPGQFLMLRLAGCDDPLIGRPLALYDTVLGAAGQPEAIDVVYLVKGKLTSRLEHFRPGQQLDVWGPLGNGFLPQSADHLIMVAGGIGQTPFPALAREHLGLRRYGDPPREVAPAHRVTLCYGARTAELLAGVEDFERLGVEVRLATDDGTRGRHGLATDLLEELLDELLDEVLDEATRSHRVVCCGPEPMMEAAAEIAGRRGVPCQVSLETPMACGVGICFTCVARVRDESGEWDYKRTCVEGPVFDAACIEW
jgi:dihydroorotate dehydrogenase electron transfer subunit